MNKKEVLEQIKILHDADAIVTVEVKTTAGCMQITNRSLINQIIGLIISELTKEKIYEEGNKSHL